jgi:hypothetical protein
MDHLASTLLLSIIPAVTAGVITAIVSVRLALRRFRAERWFERKAQAYTDLFTGLSHIQRYCALQIESLEEGTQRDDKYMKTLSEQASAGFAEIRRAAALGEFLFGLETAKRLARLESALEAARASDDIHEQYSDDEAAVSGALKDLRKLAKDDLSRAW